MPQFLAVTSKGLSPVLEQELQKFKVRDLKPQGPSWLFESSWKEVYDLHLRVGSAVRFLLPVLDFVAYTPEELYDQVKKCDFTKYISKENTFKVEVSLQPSYKWTDSRFVGLKVKDAIVDLFYESYDSRPDVDKKNFDLCVRVAGSKNHFSISLDLTGSPSLAHRGYRPPMMEAPLREHLAYGLLKHTGWDGTTPVIDLMCGSGTFLVEAALMHGPALALNRKEPFSFQKLKTFQDEAWQQVVRQAIEEEDALEQTCPPLFGFDISGPVVDSARISAKNAMVEDLIEFRKRPVSMVENPCPDQPGIVIVNPPYGHRLKSDQIKDSYRDLGYALKNQFKGWQAWVLSSDPELTACIGLKSTVRIPVWNGGIECRFLNYPVR